MGRAHGAAGIAGRLLSWSRSWRSLRSTIETAAAWCFSSVAETAAARRLSSAEETAAARQVALGTETAVSSGFFCRRPLPILTSFQPMFRSFAIEEEAREKSEEKQEKLVLKNEIVCTRSWLTFPNREGEMESCSSSDSFYPWSKKKVIRADKLFKVPQLITEIGRDPFRPMVRGFTTSSTEEKVTSSSTKDEKEVTSSSTKDEEEVARKYVFLEFYNRMLVLKQSKVDVYNDISKASTADWLVRAIANNVLQSIGGNRLLRYCPTQDGEEPRMHRNSYSHPDDKNEVVLVLYAQCPTMLTRMADAFEEQNELEPMNSKSRMEPQNKKITRVKGDSTMAMECGQYDVNGSVFCF
uniref:Uncharacterized protein n=1 Tax=Oryza barthii TaxID=65489 RepID=A0A0D3FG34_9ORYZ